ncbi:hypothetical protein COW36_20995 [bacterium (Candidatus Blackallbacteria) CG17_big_fil_post_rev_8_21_14_2_50_48_46]|uniref:Biotin transporter n=1 Tax=bacterium (Candidatus Blackallbacteria) CG17_big_fil_post_rev_8_21_14_2_50_48_46 TaxID=2014261 RepID=A0A2M7FYR6_9BACT|nr:MAG: hypothetical protein COW64_14305 [bacterium (Candidatus Blackallbacteria) CG18_big_fil_WC_8_21_14_2_50_49_26]PIW14520.1 MAG: hypothetical protein COW36_20995 [bacterium (Candidatus Blackallbacteria) CG17_big_fil_post_rev_8_21_14_2_50_48_46]PIW47205.1 MAG: hypothetical protein COW20_13440 [bacterium (Candidatus Blackallbacteria) CG13_big_fil_rev_8_21_14_2_50_49_14]
MLRVLVRFLGVALFITLLIMATFVHLRMPYFSLVPPQLPDAEPWFNTSWLYVGSYTSNLQLMVVMACVLILSTPLATFTLLVYLLLGLTGLPIYYQGGGIAYLSQPTTGYLISLLPSAWFCALLLRRHPRRQPLPGPYLLAAVLTLVMIQVMGGIYASVYFQMVPVQFLASYTLPQLPWQITVLSLLALIIFEWNKRIYRVKRLEQKAKKNPPANSAPMARRRLQIRRA